jgi:hypothetical protein
MADAALAARVDAIESRLACADLVHAYARLIRSDRPDLVHTLFTADGTFEVRDGHPDSDTFTVRSRYASPTEIHANMAPNRGKPHPLPLIHNLTIAVNGDTATGNAVMEAQIYGASHKVIGEYHDTFRREDGEWRFAARIYTIFSGASSI